MKSVGAYEIVGRLGRGGMSTVYKAKAPFSGRLVALKILQPRNEVFVDLVGWAALCRAFLAEARIMAGFAHPHIAQVVDCGEHEACPYIVLEYYSHSVGGVLGEAYRIEEKARPLQPGTALRYLQQTLKGLVRLHAAGIIHRDIKPYNLMLTSDNRIKIIDFGLSRVRGEELLAVPGMQVGSPYYAAPELRQRDGLVDGRADLYSLAVVAYRMLTGCLLGTEAVLPAAWPRDWRAFMERSLQLNPKDRFASAEEMLVAMEGLGEECLVGEELLPQAAVGKAHILRSQPQRILFKDVARKLGLDKLLRPLVSASSELVEIDSFQAVDRGAGLLWQRRGSGYPMTTYQAHHYIEHLNEVCWRDRQDWRLPTLAELLTLLPCRGQATLSAPGRLFSSDIHWLWSSDLSNKKQAWAMDFMEGYVERLDKDGAASVCAVSSL
ncbi:protein kinase domain-containing protein [Desulfotalea psychrophila]|uniref:Related to serine/threonine-protein kinase n=1 Tax=Desulfotalea psychrophila (strain LSv54 / DSM 12343) TaxID=177439 RepID=Q6APJ3_DESPS|nr:protein kinase [Desulfotalea psychrophila]CAG35731.1 related to serine/threonine-protein kinase [Desulfotalea psychrophila LSv54]